MSSLPDGVDPNAPATKAELAHFVDRVSDVIHTQGRQIDALNDCDIGLKRLFDSMCQRLDQQEQRIFDQEQRLRTLEAAIAAPFHTIQ